MSSHRLDIAADARKDIRTILRTSGKTWGADQRTRYGRQLRDAMILLTEFPELGLRCEQYAPSLRSHRVQQHVVYYVVEDDAITVARVLHVRMDAANVFRS